MTRYHFASQRRFRIFLTLSFIVMLTSAAIAFRQLVTAQVSPTVETDPVHSGGDSADDMCVWIHPTDPALSTIIGADKNGGMSVYDLTGHEIQFISADHPNNVDIRYNFSLGGAPVTLVGFSNTSDKTLGFYKVDPATRMLVNVEARQIKTGKSVYGFCLYQSPVSGKFYCFVTDNANGELQQWEVFDNGSGLVDATKVRTIQVGSHSEGLVADDIHKYLYVSQEDVAIWKYGAEPGDGSARTQVDAVANGRLEDDIEGLTIYYTSNGNGYLIASSQGSKDYVIYQREGNNPYVMTFAIVPGNGIDGTNETDGIDVINFPLGTAFPFGVFLAQDGTNDNGNQNFKLVPWQSIANAASPALTIDTTWDPRQTGGSSCDVNAEFQTTTISGCAPLAVNFTDQSTPQGGVTSWSWNFGDGNSSTLQNPSHTFTTAGTYTVQLTVNSATCSNTEIKTKYITVSSMPSAAFTGAPNSGGAPLTVNFTDQSTPQGGATWSWDFGDGGSSSLKSPSHQYNAPGTYTVSLTVTNACGGDGEIKTDYVTVSNCAPGNVARGKSATASSVRSGYPASYAVDGNTSTKWKSNSGGVQWLEVDLGSPHETDDAVIRWDGSNRAKDFEFQYWDGSNWVSLFSQTNNGNSTSTINFAATCAQKFRVYMTKPNSSRYYIKELEINGCPCTTLSKSSFGQIAPPVNQTPNEIILQPNYPNPFNPRTNINFTLPQEAQVTLKVYSLAGAEVATLVNGRREAGAHTVVFDAANLPSGVYFSILQAQEVRQVQRLLLMK